MDEVQMLMDADLRAVVERAVRAQSLVMVDQYLRQAEDDLASLEDAAEVAAQINALLERKLDEHRKKAASFDRAVEAFLLDGNETAAAASQSRLNSVRRLIESYARQGEQQQREAQALADAMNTVEDHHAHMKALRAETQALLEAMQRQPGPLPAGTTLAEAAAEAESEVGRRAQRLVSRLEALGPAPKPRPASLDDPLEQLLDRKRVDAQLAERRAKLPIGA
jgi:phage shock protein A